MHHMTLSTITLTPTHLNTEDNCDFTLTLTDGAGDGWFGSWIGVVQGDEIFGPFTMHPPDGFEKDV